MTFVRSKHKTDPSTMHDLAVKIEGWEGRESFNCSYFNVKIPSDANIPGIFLDLQKGQRLTHKMD